MKRNLLFILVALLPVVASADVSDTNPTESLYGEWWLVGWNDEGTWFEVDTNFVSHRHLSIEIPIEGYVMAYSLVNEIFVGYLTLNGNDMIFTEGGASSMVYSDVYENLFFEEHICDIKSYLLDGNQLKLYYTNEDYFVFTNDFDDSEEHHYEWKNGPADTYISEVTAMNDQEVEVKIVQCPSYVTCYSRTTPPRSSSDICRFATSDLAGLSFEVGDKVAFRIIMFKRQKVEKGREYQLKVEPSEGTEQITNRTGKMHNDRRMGWIIIDDKVNEKQGGIYYYPLRKLAEEYLTEGVLVKFSGELYPTWKTPWDNEGHSDCYYLSIDAINTSIESVSFTEGQIATIILPEEPDASKGKYYRLDRVEEGQIIFEQELQPQAHVPYIIVPSKDFSIDPNNMDLEGLSCDTVSIDGVSFIGSYVSKELNNKEGFYIDIIDTTSDCFSPSGETGTFLVGALRAYLQVNWDDPYNHGGMKGPEEKMQIVLRDYGTGLEAIHNSQFIIHNYIYDLQGRLLPDKPSKGIYIESGQKKIR